MRSRASRRTGRTTSSTRPSTSATRRRARWTSTRSFAARDALGPRGPAMIASVKGTRDLLPPETRVWNRVEAAAREVFALYGFDEIRTPVLESTELFVRSVGESTDIVHKEMYTFTDRSGRSVTLRPERSEEH